jgi:hypothetical protein
MQYPVIIGLLLILSVQSSAAAQEPLRWKLSKGAELHYEVKKTAQTTLTERQSHINVSQEQIFDVRWQVEDMREDGSADIVQTIERVRLKLVDPLGEIAYDSLDDEEPPAVAALAGSLFHELRKHPVRFSLTARGQVTNFDVSDEVLEAFKASPLADALAGFASEEKIQRLVLPELSELPADPLSIGQSWSHSAEFTNPAFGKQVMETNYTYGGDQEVDGHKLAALKITLKLSPAGETKGTVELQPAESSGEMLFDPAQGRLVSSRIELRLQATSSTNGEKVEGILAQSSETKLTEGR